MSTKQQEHANSVEEYKSEFDVLLNRPFGSERETVTSTPKTTSQEYREVFAHAESEHRLAVRMH